jgi:protein TonB
MTVARSSVPPGSNKELVTGGARFAGSLQEPGSSRDQDSTMTKFALPPEARDEVEPTTANDLFKNSFARVFWLSMILATGIHFAVFDFWPDMTAEVISYSSDELTAIEFPPEIEIPPAPKTIARPATPVIAPGAIDEDITIAPTTFEENPVSDLPPPPRLDQASTAEELARAPVFTPYTVRPDVKNRAEVKEALKREYPRVLRDAGLGGTVYLWFFIDENGRTVRSLVHQSSGHPMLDDAALRVAQIVQFTPALNRDKRVPVWISLPISFVAR